MVRQMLDAIYAIIYYVYIRQLIRRRAMAIYY